ncbi:MAG: hypothetical protein IH855_10275 [Bacteroidetes bacterium]|nr:hypothetical protein [Bacteroidota bacterium]
MAYTTTTGTGFENTVDDILNHALLHGMYHGGQAASALRAADTAPPAIDYIKWVRLGKGVVRSSGFIVGLLTTNS